MKGTIIDVRSHAEFMGGHVAGSINIPLQEIGLKINDIKEMEQPVILCCASGMRSGQAQSILSSRGIKCENGGSWMSVNFQVAESK